ncbi:hypothetical protein ACRBEV_10380 [Methylobacterium phyllosphaerae]
MNLFFKAAAVALPTLATGIVLAASTSQDAGSLRPAAAFASITDPHQRSLALF